MMSGRKKTKVSADLLLDARWEHLEMIELLGTASGQLREAVSDYDMGNTQGALIVLDDFLGTLAELESKTSEVAAMAARWRSWAEQSLEEGGAA